MKRYRVLMLGPALSVKGGITTVEQLYLDAWDYSRYDLRHIGTLVDGSKVLKLLIALKAFIQSCYRLATWKPDILHIHLSWRASFYRKSLFVILGKIFRTKIILHCNASRFDIFYDSSSKLKRKFIRLILSSADRMLVVSQQWRRYFEGLFLSVPLHVIYNPVVCPPGLSRGNDRKAVVLSLGQLGRRKGTYDILQAIPRVLEVCPQAEFWFGGHGEVEDVERILKTKPWRDHVRLLGWVTGDRKEDVLTRAALFVLPSYHEGLPLAILEAMAYGLPVVSTPVGGIPEAVIDGETGFLVEPGDVEAIAQRVTLLLSDAELRGQMGMNARRRALEKFEVGVVIQQLFAIYDELITER